MLAPSAGRRRARRIPRARRGSPTLNGGCRPGARARAPGRAPRAPRASAARRGGSRPGGTPGRRSSGSLSTSSPSAAQSAWVSARRNDSSGRTTRPCRGAMPASPDAAAPRSTLSSTVSAWSSAVWPTRTTSAPTVDRGPARAPRSGRRGPEPRGWARGSTGARVARNSAPRRAAIAATTSASRALPVRSRVIDVHRDRLRVRRRPPARAARRSRRHRNSPRRRARPSP